MRRKLLTTIKNHRMFSPGDRVVVGLSGGADSVTLLHLLASLEEYNLSLFPCHINHNLRGEEALRDQKFCEALCETLGLSLKVFSEDAAAYAEEHGMTLEEGARDLRYSCFSSFCEEVGAFVIVTAHTLSDSSETVLFSLSRGTGLAGLCGIPPVREFDGLRIARPLIGCTREEIESYCQVHELSYVTDSTNLSDDYTRNRIRHQLMPLLRSLNPSVEEAIGRMTELLRQDDMYLKQQTVLAVERLSDKAGGLERSGFLALEPALQGRVLLSLLEKRQIPYDQKRISLCLEIAGRGKGAVELCRDVFFKANDHRLWLERALPMQPYFSFTLNPSLTQWHFEIAGKIYHLRILVCEQTEKFEKSSCNILKNTLDYDTIYGIVKLRQKMNGDVCAPIGRAGRRSLKKLYQDAKIPPEKRKRMAVLADEQGVLWAEEFGCDRRAAPTEGTRRLLEITVETLV